jgi:predicted metal-binding protein
MSRPVLLVCTRCEPGGKHRGSGGESLFERVRELRKTRGLKEVFKVEEVDCLGLCDEANVVELSGKKRSTYTRTRLDARSDVEAVVEMACAYAALEPGGELPERGLPGEHAD